MHDAVENDARLNKRGPMRFGNIKRSFEYLVFAVSKVNVDKLLARSVRLTEHLKIISNNELRIALIVEPGTNGFSLRNGHRLIQELLPALHRQHVVF